MDKTITKPPQQVEEEKYYRLNNTLAGAYHPSTHATLCVRLEVAPRGIV